MISEKNKLINSFIIPAVVIVVIWIIHFISVFFNIDFHQLGILPLKIKGLYGIIFSPLIHDDWSHLYANTAPLFILLSALFYFIKK